MTDQRAEALAQARMLAADFLRARGKGTDAEIIDAGGGDDFPEVMLARSVVISMADRVRQLERALRCYADPTFWDDDDPFASLAYHDRGEIAKDALRGREAFARHRD